jgi:hypothetical protein
MEKNKLNITGFFVPATPRTRNISGITTDYKSNRRMFLSDSNSSGIKTMIKNIQIKKRLDLTNFHKNSLLETFRTRSTTDHMMTTCNSVLKTFRSCESYSEKNLKNEKLETNSKYFYKSVTGSNFINNKSVGEFSNKINHIAKMKYFLKLQNERKENIEEELNNELDGENEDIIDIHKKEKLFDEFLEKLDKFIKYLRTQKELESIKLSGINFELALLKNDITKLITKKVKLENEFELKKECKVFLQCLKDNSNANPPAKKQAKARNTTCFNADQSIPSKKIIKLFQKQQTLNLAASQNLKRQNEIKNEDLIYKSSDEVIKDFTNLQIKVVELIKVYDDNDQFIKKMKQSNIESNADPEKSKEIKELENILNIEKQKFAELTKEKERLMHSDHSDTIPENILDKIKTLFNLLNIEGFVQENKKIYLHDHSHINETILILKKIEPAIYYLIENYENLKINESSKYLLTELEKKLEKSRKLNTLKNNEEKILFKNKQMLDRIIEKHQKLVIKGRKVADKFNIVKKFKKTAEDIRKDEEKEFDDMITFWG